MNITQKLKDFELTFDCYLELDPEGCEAEAEELKEFYDEWNRCFSDDESDLYEIVYALMEDAQIYHESELNQERAEQLADEMRYEGSQGYR